MRLTTPRVIAIAWLMLCIGLLAGCAQNMREGSRLDPYEPSAFFEDGQSARPLVPNTVARGQLRADEHFYTGRTGSGQEGATPEPGAPADATAPAGETAQGRGTLVDTFPYPVTREVMERGQERYNIYCAPCHGLAGYGDGMIVQRGFTSPPSFHSDELRGAPVGHYYDVITNGFGAMYPYASRVPPADRWAIIAYIRALQLSQNATLEDVPEDERQNFQGAP